MTAATVVGIACAEDDVGAQYFRGGRLERAESFRKLIPEIPSGGVPIDVEHGGQPVGEMVHAELDSGGRLGVVAVVEDGDWLLGYGGPVYFSPELLTIAPGVHTRAVAIADAAALVSLSLTDSPATISAHPLTVMPGDARRQPDRMGWPMSWRAEHALLSRCVDGLPESRVEARHHRARRIYRDPVVTRIADHFWIDEHGEPVAGHTRKVIDAEGHAVELCIRPSTILSVGGRPVRR